MTYPLEDQEISQFENAMHDMIMGLPETDRYKKSKKAFLDNLWEDVEEDIIDRMSEVVASRITDMASRVVTEILEGNEDQMRRYLGADGYTVRSDKSLNPISRVHPVIHGTLFETGAIALRKKIAQSHTELIQNERISDLEDQVKSLVAQVNEKDSTIEKLRDQGRSKVWGSPI